MRLWARAISFFLFVWLLSRWWGLGFFAAPDLRRAALWAAIALGLFLLCRDGRPLLLRLGLLRADSPLLILDERLAKGEIDLDTYRLLREEILSSAGILGAKANRVKSPVLRGDRLE